MTVLNDLVFFVEDFAIFCNLGVSCILYKARVVHEVRAVSFCFEVYGIYFAGSLSHIPLDIS